MRGLIYMLLLTTGVVVVLILWLGVQPEHWGERISAALTAVTPGSDKKGGAASGPSGKPAPFPNPAARKKDGRPVPAAESARFEPEPEAPVRPHSHELAARGSSASQIGHAHDRKLQSLGSVDRHQADGVQPLPLEGRLALRGVHGAPARGAEPHELQKLPQRIG